MKVGDVIINKAGDCHGFTNTTDKNFKFLGVLTPIPAEYVALENQEGYLEAINTQTKE